MNCKLLGAILIISGCSITAFRIAAGYLKEERTLRQLVSALDYMECELQYHLTPLPDLCRKTAGHMTGQIKAIFLNLSKELEAQIHPDVYRCMAAVIAKSHGIPTVTVQMLQFLGRSMGRFDLDGQLKGLEAVRLECRTHLSELSVNKDMRIRSYQTLGLCAGAAIAILLV